MLYDTLFKKNNNNTQFGNAQFMDWSTQRSYFRTNTKNGFCIDGKKYLLEKHLFNHLICCAPSGSGKSTIIINHLLNASKKDDYSLFVLDVSGELENICRPHLESVGFSCSRLDFTNPNDSDKYNPLKRATLTANGIQELSELLICPEAKATKSFWEQSAISLIETLLMGILSDKQKDKEKKNLLGLYNLLNLIVVKPNEAIEFMAQNLDESHYMEFASFMGMEPKLKSNILASAKAPLSKLKSRVIQELTSTDTLDLRSLRTQKKVLFLRLEEGKEQYYRFLLSIFNTQFVEMALEMPQKNSEYKPIYMFWDEFPSFTVSQFPQMVSVLRKRKIALFVFIQEVSQIENNYGKNNTKTILANMQNQIYFGNLRMEQALQIEKLLSTKTEEVNGVLRAMPLMRADEIIGMKPFQFLYINGLDSIVLKVKPWFKSSKLKKRANV